ncbi:MAG: hypothetical protein ACRD2N_10980 [Vicinamibacterales bacterium]
MPISRVTAIAVLIVAALTLSAAAREQKALVNADVIDMVKSGLPETTVIRALQAGVSEFDISPAALIALHEAGVPQNVMDAMIEATSRKTAKPAGGATRSSTRTPSRSPSSRGPTVSLIQGDSRQPIAVEHTRLSQTTKKPASLASLATDAAVNEAMRAGVSVARSSAGRAGGSAAGKAAKVISGLVDRPGSKTVTYVWILQKPTSPTEIESDSPVFELALNNTTGISAADYSPALIALTPTPNGFRLVGATEGKTGATTGTVVDWPVYSAFVEDRVAAETSQPAAGTWRLAATTALLPGEYGIVLRPVKKDHRFAGAQVARNQGEGLVFNSVWSFSLK